MNNLFKTTLSLAAFAGLAACGGGSTSTNPYQTLQNRTDAYLEQTRLFKTAQTLIWSKLIV